MAERFEGYKPLRVSKFGGASLANGAKIIESRTEVVSQKEGFGLVVVASAGKNVTNRLESLTKETVHNFDKTIHKIVDDHSTMITELGFAPETSSRLQNGLLSSMDALVKRVQSSTGSDEDKAWIMTQGERLMVPIFQADIDRHAQSIHIPAGDIFVAEGSYEKATGNNEKISEKVKKQVMPHILNGEIVVTEGYQGIDEQSGKVKAFGRGGSDYSAALIAAAAAKAKFFVEAVYLNKDETDGVYTMDPHKYPDLAKFIDFMTYLQAKQMSANGQAKVLHELTAETLEEHNVPIIVRKPGSANLGTVIWNAPIDDLEIRRRNYDQFAYVA